MGQTAIGICAGWRFKVYAKVIHFGSLASSLIIAEKLQRAFFQSDFVTGTRRPQVDRACHGPRLYTRANFMPRTTFP